MRRRLEGPWLEGVERILAPQDDDEEPERRDEEAVCALLSTQVRGVVDRSVQAYAAFFARFAKEGLRAPHQVVQLGDRDEQEDAFLTASLTAEAGEIQFTTPLDQVTERLVAVYRDFVVSLRGLQRPRARWAPRPPDAPAKETLWEVSLDEPHVAKAEQAIRDVIGRSLANVEQALTLYDDYKHLLTEGERVEELSDNPSLTQEDYMAEVKHIYIYIYTHISLSLYIYIYICVYL